MPAILILTPDPADPDFGDLWREQARGFAAALGPDAAFAPWTTPIEPGAYAVVLPLLAWGYHRDSSRWLDAIDRWEAAGVPLANPAPVLRWNSDKRYLLALAERGAPIVPTLLFDDLRPIDIEQAEAHFGTTSLIAKPPVSAGAQGIVQLDRKRRLGWDFFANPKLDWEPALGRAMLLQPLMPAIHDEGELSLFIFAGRFSHAAIKRPTRGDFRVQHQHGGTCAPLDPPQAACSVAEAVLAAVAEPLLYARIDLIADGHGNYLLMELEAIEPVLFLELAPDEGKVFADAIAAHIASTYPVSARALPPSSAR